MGTDKTILIIEDEKEIRQLANWVSELGGYRALEAETGEQGLETLRHHQVALVLLDLRLPGRDGWSILQEMKQDTALQSIPVIIFTASAGTTDQEKARTMGAAMYLIKPVSALQLMTAITEVLTARE